MTNDTPVHTEDVIPVRSRISWAAVLAGSILALALYFLLTLLGTAIGLSVHDRMADRSLAIGAVVWAILVTAGCLFLGGFVASQLTTGENKIEGMLYGLMVWAAVFALLATGVRYGFSAMIGMANAANTTAAANGGTWEDMALRSGVPQNEVDRMRATIPDATARAREAAGQATEEHATRAAWYAFLGTLVSMLAGAIGGYVGSGPTLRLFTVRVQQPGGAGFDRRDTFVRT